MVTHDSVTDSKVEDALSAVLLDDKFAAAPQMSAFLKYVVTQTLYEDPSRIKAYTVAVDALGKPPTFDPQNDPSVRVLAKRLRGSLDTYYENNPKTEIIIEMKAGSYVPHFVYRDVSEAVETTPPAAVDPIAQPNQSTESIQTDDVDAITQVNPAVAALARATSNQQTPVSQPEVVAVKAAGVQATFHAGAASVESTPASDALDENLTSTLQQADTLIQVPSLLHTRTEPSPATHDADTPVNLRVPGNQATVEVSAEATYSAPYPAQEAAAAESVNHSAVKAPSILDRVRAIPGPALAMGLFAGLVWFAIAGGQDKEQARPLGAAMPFSEITGKASEEYRPRPDKLTIVGVNLSGDTTLGRSVVDTVSTVVSRFDHVDLHRQQDRVIGTQRWPEDYQIHLQVASVSGRSEINVQLIHAKSSRVAYNETLNLQSAVGGELSEADYIYVQNSAARWMQSDGPIIRDYHINATSRTEEMACYIGVIAVDLHSDSAQIDSCRSLTDENESDTETTMVYRAWKMLTDYHNDESADAVTDPNLSLETAARAVELSPYSGYAHITLAMAQELVGDTDGSVRSVENAIMLNPLDANILKRSARISENNGDAEKAERWRTKAAQLSLQHLSDY